MLSSRQQRFLETRRVARLATADTRGIPHVVPVCFVIANGTLYVTIDEKPKRQTGTPLKRLRNIAENPAVAILADRYDEDWTRLGWIMLRPDLALGKHTRFANVPGRLSLRRDRARARPGAAARALFSARRNEYRRFACHCGAPGARGELGRSLSRSLVARRGATLDQDQV